MKKRHTGLHEISGLMIIVFMFSCKSATIKTDRVWSDLPGVTKLDSFKQTAFVPALESLAPVDKNTVYAPALLLAWNKIVETLGSPVLISNSNSSDFKSLITSGSYINSLADSEYIADIKVLDGEIEARAFFNKTMPFEPGLQSLDESIAFNQITKVASFGMDHFNENALKIASVLYYGDDDHFILKLIPKDNAAEIILVKGLSCFESLADAIKQTTSLIDKGDKEKADVRQSWKYEIKEGDIFSIPIIKFNIVTNYKTIEGQGFSTKDNRTYTITTAFQRTGFILDENGAVVESEANIKVDTAAFAMPITAHSKSMIFDKPFLVIAKHRSQVNPYFVLAVNNAELLMKKE